MQLEVSGPQWNSIVDLVNVSLFHGWHEVKATSDSFDVSLSVDSSGFTLNVDVKVKESE